ncbi:alpha/beta fold hydrolase [Fictibacillus sp. 18YEL24]|uniref:alpha/beta fold hydrolase n=1 Tax=Fictibacillus sp. 18YEL24 TaxID=2745875 RepID=UPI001E33BA0F|nr:alpha/beta fold hydrolase [Fictibacillus sp. 18YEL24]
MLHGFMGTAKTHFSSQISYFEDSHELILLDLPGHGQSPVTASENYFENAVEFVISQIKKYGDGFILGLSLGASLAIHIALREAELVKGIIVTGYSPFIPEDLKEVMENQYEYFLNIEENDKNIATHFNNLHGDKWLDTLKKVLHTMTFNYPTMSMEDIKKIKPPVLMINGSIELHEVEAAIYLKKQNNEFEIGLIPFAGHTANIDQPEIYNRMVSSFLEKARIGITP